jgi:hypothetical protein
MNNGEYASYSAESKSPSAVTVALRLYGRPVLSKTTNADKGR